MKEPIRVTKQMPHGVRIGGIKFKYKPTPEQIKAGKLVNRIKNWVKSWF